MLAAVVAPAHAAMGEWVEGGNARMRLIASGVDAEGRLAAAIEIMLAPGWHTYWRSPGDAGIAPVADFSASRNIGPVALAFPVPKRLDDGTSVTNVYDGHVVLPLETKVAYAASPVDLTLKLDIGVCAEVCLPDHFEATLEVAPGATDAAAEALLVEADKALPGPPIPGRFAVESVGMSGGGDKRPAFDITATLPDAKGAVVFVEGPGDWYGDAPKLVSTSGNSAVYRVEFDRLTATTPIKGAALRVTIVSGGHAIEQTIALDAAS
jgi:DsbC/DsbD-like thiol-disulfide interchange protein